MKYLKKFESFPGDNYTLNVKSSGSLDTPDGSTIEPIHYEHVDDANLVYKTQWESKLPEKITINYKGDNQTFRKGNIMLVGDLVEITYESYPDSQWGKPDCLEFDLYFAKDNSSNKIRTTIDITYGDLMACEFSIEPPNKVNVIQNTTYNSKFDPSDTVFALEDKSLDQFIKFLNEFPEMKLTRSDLRFLDKYDNWSDK